MINCAELLYKMYAETKIKLHGATFFSGGKRTRSKAGEITIDEHGKLDKYNVVSLFVAKGGIVHIVVEEKNDGTN